MSDLLDGLDSDLTGRAGRLDKEKRSRKRKKKRNAKTTRFTATIDIGTRTALSRYTMELNADRNKSVYREPIKERDLIEVLIEVFGDYEENVRGGNPEEIKASLVRAIQEEAR